MCIKTQCYLIYRNLLGGMMQRDPIRCSKTYFSSWLNVHVSRQTEVLYALEWCRCVTCPSYSFKWCYSLFVNIISFFLSNELLKLKGRLCEWGLSMFMQRHCFWKMNTQDIFIVSAVQWIFRPSKRDCFLTRSMARPLIFWLNNSKNSLLKCLSVFLQYQWTRELKTDLIPISKGTWELMSLASTFFLFNGSNFSAQAMAM